MSALLPPFDLDAVRDAIEHRDPGAFGAIARQLGIAIAVDPLIAYAARFAAGDWLVQEIVEVIYRARHGEHGYAHNGSQRGLGCLVVRHGDRYVVGIQRNRYSDPFPKTGWTMGRWYKDPARNITTVAIWAADPARATDAIAIPIVGDPVASTGDPRGEALLGAVVADPDDVEARLVYADWLLERGDVRGELIRVQCALAGGGLALETQRALRIRNADLELAHRAAIGADVAPHVVWFAIGRGLVERVSMAIPKLAKFGPAIRARHPIRALRVNVNDAKGFARLARPPIADLLARLHTLELAVAHRFRPVSIAPGAMTFPTLRRLALDGWMDADAARFLATLAGPSLDTLELAGRGFGSDTVDAARHVQTLQTIVLRDVQVVEPAALARLVASPSIRRIEFRGWSEYTNTVAASVRAVLGGPGVVELSLQQCNAMLVTIDALVTDGRRLERLALDCGEPLAALLAQLDRFPVLRVLEISDRAATAEVIATIAARLVAAPPTLTTVRWLDSRLSVEVQDAIAATRTFEI